jgi:nicotinamidase-related amidase
MQKILIVVDMQNDFITGSLKNDNAKAILPNVVNKINEYIPLVKEGNAEIIYTLDTHSDNYLETQEGENLPVVHCIEGSEGWRLHSDVEKALDGFGTEFIKRSFGSIGLADKLSAIHKECSIDEIEIIGVVSSICVVSNALIIKAALPEVKVSVSVDCIAGMSDEDNNAAITVMKCCQVNII